jgi:cbb3-type cytochrome oxidase subunit 3
MSWIVAALTVVGVAFLGMVYYDQNKERRARAADGEATGSKTRARIILVSVAVVLLAIITWILLTTR